MLRPIVDFIIGKPPTAPSEPQLEERVTHLEHRVDKNSARLKALELKAEVRMGRHAR
jgi:hypothetical protein